MSPKLPNFFDSTVSPQAPAWFVGLIAKLGSVYTDTVYPLSSEMIHSFKDKRTEDLYHGYSSNRVRHLSAELRIAALNKLDMIQAAIELIDLRSPPGNRFEALAGDLKGWFSIRVNDQWRIIFRWKDSSAYDFQLVDYH